MGTLLNLMGLGVYVKIADNLIIQVCCVFLPNQFTTLASSLTNSPLLKSFWELQLMFFAKLSCSTTSANTSYSPHFPPKWLYFSFLVILYAYIPLVFFSPRVSLALLEGFASQVQSKPQSPTFSVPLFKHLKLHANPTDLILLTFFDNKNLYKLCILNQLSWSITVCSSV